MVPRRRSPGWTGTVTARPSGWRRRTWLPLDLTTEKPVRCRAAKSSRAVTRGIPGGAMGVGLGSEGDGHALDAHVGAVIRDRLPARPEVLES